jgi:hypothetical protein
VTLRADSAGIWLHVVPVGLLTFAHRRKPESEIFSNSLLFLVGSLGLLAASGLDLPAICHTARQGQRQS